MLLVPQICHIPSHPQPFSVPFTCLECSFPPLCLSYSHSSGPHFLGEHFPALRCWVQFLCNRTFLSLIVLFSVFNYALLYGIIWSACPVFPLAWKLLASGSHACFPSRCLPDAQHRAWCVAGVPGKHGWRARLAQTWKKVPIACHKDHQRLFLTYQSTNIASLEITHHLWENISKNSINVCWKGPFRRSSQLALLWLWRQFERARRDSVPSSQARTGCCLSLHNVQWPIVPSVTWRGIKLEIVMVYRLFSCKKKIHLTSAPLSFIEQLSPSYPLCT